MSQKPRHYLGLRGARVIENDALKNTIDLIRMVTKFNAIGVILGEAGMGKTFSLQVALSLLPKIDFVWITLPTDTTARLVSQKVVEALTGELAEKIERNEILRLRARDLLLKRRPLLICDEAQHLHRTGIEALRFLHDVCGCCFPIILAGGNGCWDVLSEQKMLRSRVFDQVRHAPMSEEDLLEILPGYHPIYADVDPDILRMVNDKYCEGVFRNWAGFTLKAVDRLETSKGKLDKAFATKVLQSFPTDALSDAA